MLKVLVTCVGSGVGQSVIDSLNLTGRYYIIGCDTNRNVYAYQFCNDFEIVPSIYSEGYVDFLVKLCQKKKVDIVIPGHDHELLLLSKNIGKFENQGINVLVSCPDIIEISRDKYEWFRYFTKYGCSIVPTYRVAEFKKNPVPEIFPAIVKPSGGSASQGILILNDISELSNAEDDDIIQPYLFPKKDDPNYETIKKVVTKGKFVQMSEISIQLIFTNESEFAGIFISKNSLKAGIPIFIDPIDPNEFEYIDEIMKFVPICKEKKVKGPVNIQGRITEKGLVFFEMNMRFTGITGNRAQLAFNEVEFLVNNFLGLPANLGKNARNKLGVRQVACTTITRATKNEQKKTYSIIGALETVGKKFIKKLIDLDDYHKVYVICNNESYSDYINTFNDTPIQVIIESNQSLESIYCKSDVLINFLNTSVHKTLAEKYQSILFQHKQIKKIIKANIPIIINLLTKQQIKKEDNTDVFTRNIVSDFFETITSFCPTTKLFTIDLKTNKILPQVKKDVNDNSIIELLNSIKNSSLEIE